jgi:glucan phosphoethanolaminetransferase (alkaline phosphatase superfamily)
MEELTLQTLLAVFEEMFGLEVFWAMVGVSALAALLFLWVVIRDGGIRARRFTRAELLAPVGGAAAVAFVWAMTNSGLREVGRPIDLLALAGVFLAGAGGAVVIGYILGGLLGPRRA